MTRNKMTINESLSLLPSPLSLPPSLPLFVRLVFHSSLSPSSEGRVLSRLRASPSYNSRGQERVKGTGQHYSGNFF